MTSRRLVLIRHAKSSWKDDTLTDHQRPLNKRGMRTAPFVARWLVEQGWAPDAALGSSALRAVMTWRFLAPELEEDVPWIQTRDLYHADAAAIRGAVGAVDPSVRTLWLIGHNPGLEQTADALAGHTDPIKTADAVLLTSEGETWLDAIRAPWRVQDHLTARTVDPKGRPV